MPMPLTLKTPPRRVAVLALALAAILALCALRTGPGAVGTAHASDTQVSIMMDDDQLVYRNDATRNRAMKKMKALGVEYVRVTVLWSVVALHARDTSAARRRFKPTQPNTYPKFNWDRYDGVVREAKALGLGVYLDVTGPGPSWSHDPAPRGDSHDADTWMPHAKDFYDFVAAVGKRYSGTYRARNRQILPRVSVWALWNEPNQGGWLTPQWQHGRAVSADIYRNLFLYGRKALDDTGHGRDFIMAGETAPLGSTNHGVRSPTYPKTFLRELMCADSHDHPLSASAAAARGCSAFEKFGPIRATAWAHHPYTKYLPPTVRDRAPDAVTMANIGDLPNLLDDLARNTHNVGTGMLVMSTEFGYETNPPDPFSGIALDKQAEYINEGDYEAFRNPRVAGNTQFLLNDAAPLRQYRRGSKRYWFTYQSGLLFNNSKPKPSLTSYLLPFDVIGSNFGTDPATGHRLYGVWGQLRFLAKPLTAPSLVFIEFRAAGSRSWQAIEPIGVYSTEAFFGGLVPVPGPGQLRAHFVSAGQRYSRTVPVKG